MAKKQTFGDKIRRRKQHRKVMAKIIVAERKPNGHYRYRERMVPQDQVDKELARARAA